MKIMTPASVAAAQGQGGAGTGTGTGKGAASKAAAAAERQRQHQHQQQQAKKDMLNHKRTASSPPTSTACAALAQYSAGKTNANGTAPTLAAVPTTYIHPRVQSLVTQLGWSASAPSSPNFMAKVLEAARAGDPRAQAIYGVLLQTGVEKGGPHPVLQKDEPAGLVWLLSASTANVIDNPQKPGAEKVAGLGVPGTQMPLNFSTGTPGAAAAALKDAGGKAFAKQEKVKGGTGGVPSPTIAISAVNMSPIFQTFVNRAAHLDPKPDTMTALANMYERGDGVIRDEITAFNLYCRAAELGGVMAIFKVGFAFEKGKDYVRARHWYRLATARGHFPSNVRLAALTLDCAYEAIDVLEAAAMTVKTARALHDYAIGLSTTKNGAVPSAKDVRMWYRRAAQAGHVRSQYLLGKVHTDSAKGNANELKKAFYWYHSASIQGYRFAQIALSEMYRHGHGVEKDEKMAERWNKAQNRTGMEKCRREVADAAMVTVFSLTESVSPVWNVNEPDRPPSAATFTNEEPVPAPIPGSAAAAAAAAVKASPMRFKVGVNAQNGKAAGMPTPLAPNNVFAEIPAPTKGAASEKTEPPVAAVANGATSDPLFEPLDVECEGYRSMPAFYDAMMSSPEGAVANPVYAQAYMAASAFKPSNPAPPANASTPAFDANFEDVDPTHLGATSKALQDVHGRVPVFYEIAHTIPSHPITGQDLSRVKVNFLRFEHTAIAGKHGVAVMELARGFRALQGLFDLLNHQLRLLAAVSVQKVISDWEDEGRTLVVQADGASTGVKKAAAGGNGMGLGPAAGEAPGKDPRVWTELRYEAGLVEVFLNLFAKTPEVLIVMLDRLVAERRRAIAYNASGKPKPFYPANTKRSEASLSDPIKTEDPIPHLLRGGLRMKVGHWEAAIEEFNHAARCEEGWRESVPEIYYQRGVCYSNITRDQENRERSVEDLKKFLSMVQVDHRRVPDAHYTIAGNYFTLKNVRQVVDHFAKGLEAEAVRFPFFPPIINLDLKTRLTLEVKYALVTGGTHCRGVSWSKVPPAVLRMVEGEEQSINSIARECLACRAVGRTKTCAGCRFARYCSTNCQIAHWIRGHAQVCQQKSVAVSAE
ncbi:hypothetical protein HK101_009087 [Irineochytrium annulatum]|nr:hypothetical protein HK101_009087 [Irineochytrium annulatum]